MVALVNEYSDPNVAAAVGLNGELLVLEGFAKFEFVMRGRETNKFAGKSWTATDHNLDFIFERDGQAYGVEVKNKLSYMDREEFVTKVLLCRFLGIRPIFAARMLPKTWINELVKAGGYAMVMKYQLYPISHKVLAKQVARELGLPIDSPKALHDGTMHRLLRWHERNV